MFNALNNINVILLSLLGGLCTFFITSLGASLVFFFKKVNKNFLDCSLAVSAGIMLSSSFFSLITPAIEMSDKKDIFFIAIGLLCGGIFLIIFDILHKSFNNKKGLNKSKLLLISITLHNIPEGLILGVSFGSIMNHTNTITNALILTLAIAIQNFPEGSAISLPLRREGKSRFKSFLLGSLSAIVEPIFSVIGCVLVINIQKILPFMLTFAAGAMIYVIISELIPEYSQNKRKVLMNTCTLLGFIIMMILDTIFC